MSEITEVMHQIFEFTERTNSAIEIKVDTFEGDVQSIKTVIAPTKQKGGITNLQRVKDALTDLSKADHFFGDELGLNGTVGYMYIKIAIENLAWIEHDAEED